MNIMLQSMSSVYTLQNKDIKENLKKLSKAGWDGEILKPIHQNMNVASAHEYKGRLDDQFPIASILEWGSGKKAWEEEWTRNKEKTMAAGNPLNIREGPLVLLFHQRNFITLLQRASNEKMKSKVRRYAHAFGTLASNSDHQQGPIYKIMYDELICTYR